MWSHCIDGSAQKCFQHNSFSNTWTLQEVLSNVLIKCQHRNPNVPVKVEELLNTDSEVNTEIKKQKRSTNKLRIQLNMVNVTKGTKFVIFQGSGNTDKRFKMVAWERFSREKSYLEIGIFLIFLMNTIQHPDTFLSWQIWSLGAKGTYEGAPRPSGSVWFHRFTSQLLDVTWNSCQ